ncbi:hypothetical protein CORC01_01756 [Colletotrichum orchidophilum]|uniref:F-box domain-containing protein n=1 Tax=Colletotrichum orchidophilum TaxID=1209926 RepID=A0A1G4BNV6_9PEZI|nr:uncharacterized protein CORC01_01756 [Colletotrichum orchidophilum]OHF02998.1 hypothetical protein CORC01_01756 [Colletotrichum orchidophilum]
MRTALTVYWSGDEVPLALYPMAIPEVHDGSDDGIITFQDREIIANSVSADFFTGYHYRKDCETRQQRNGKDNRFYNIPRELVLEIILHLEAVDIFRLRQVSRIFLHLTSIGVFDDYRRQPMLQRLQQLMQSVLAGQMSPPRFSPPMMFWIPRDELVRVKESRRKQLLCQPCRENYGRSSANGSIYDYEVRLNGLLKEAICVDEPIFYCRDCVEMVGEHGKEPRIVYSPKESLTDEFMDVAMGWKLVAYDLKAAIYQRVDKSVAPAGLKTIHILKGNSWHMIIMTICSEAPRISSSALYAFLSTFGDWKAPESLWREGKYSQ